MELFDFIEAITYTKDSSFFDDEDKSSKYNIFMINRVLSEIDELVPFLSTLTLYDLDKRVHFSVLADIIPKKKYKIPFSTKKVEVNENIMKYFNCGMNDYRHIINMLNVRDIEYINSVYTYGVSK